MKKKANYKYVQLVIGVLFIIYGASRLFFGETTIGFNRKYSQTTINSDSTTSLILGIGFLIGFIIQYRQDLKNNEANSKKIIKKT